MSVNCQQLQKTVCVSLRPDITDLPQPPSTLLVSIAIALPVPTLPVEVSPAAVHLSQRSATEFVVIFWFGCVGDVCL